MAQQRSDKPRTARLAWLGLSIGVAWKTKERANESAKAPLILADVIKTVMMTPGRPTARTGQEAQIARHGNTSVTVDELINNT